MTTSQGRTAESGVAVPSALARRNIWWLTVSMFLIRIGSSTTAVALPLFVFERYGLGIGVGLALGLRLAPNILLGPLVGNLVDRWDPRRVAVLSSVGSGVVVGLFPLTDALWHVQLLSVLSGVAYMFGYPARMALRPLAMTEGTQVKGNSMLIISERLSMLLARACLRWSHHRLPRHRLAISDRGRGCAGRGRVCAATAIGRSARAC